MICCSVFSQQTHQITLNFPETECLNTLSNSPEKELYKFRIYPNPASDHFIIKSKFANSEASISDLSGKVLFSKMLFNEESRISTTQFTPGLYFVIVKSDKYVENFKLLIH